jgi:environmental stress-induced protein Ves
MSQVDRTSHGIEVIRARDARVMPWKNGGGTTTEVAVFPRASTLDDFDWRVSAARVETAGAFSSFEGVDRSMVVLEGAGLTLRFAGRGAVSLDLASLPFAFPADARVDAELVAGPVVDLNVMTRRGRWRHHLARLHVEGKQRLGVLADATLVLARGGPVTCLVGSTSEHLDDGDALLFERNVAPFVDVTSSRSMTLYVADFWSP